MNPLEDMLTTRPPTAARPLLGQTVLVVEDSRYACEAMRLMCLKSGARIRRASTLAQARRHLQTYRPNVVIIDMGLPDGSGAELIHDLAKSPQRVQVILGISGDSLAREAAESAGADGFLTKPLASLGEFQQAILAHLPADRVPRSIRAVPTEEVYPDPLALQDDLVHLADLLSAEDARENVDYVTQFLTSVALAAQDPALERAGRDLLERRLSGAPLSPAMAQLSGTIEERLTKTQHLA